MNEQRAELKTEKITVVAVEVSEEAPDLEQSIDLLARLLVDFWEGRLEQSEA